MGLEAGYIHEASQSFYVCQYVGLRFMIHYSFRGGESRTNNAIIGEMKIQTWIAQKLSKRFECQNSSEPRVTCSQEPTDSAQLLEPTQEPEAEHGERVCSGSS